MVTPLFAESINKGSPAEAGLFQEGKGGKYEYIYIIKYMPFWLFVNRKVYPNTNNSDGIGSYIRSQL
jgi:hypothetical protein